MANWYFIGAAGQSGPIDDAELRTRVDHGEITPATLVWKEGMENWAPVAEVQLPPLPVPASSQLRMTQPAMTSTEPVSQPAPKAEESGPRHACCQCKHEFPENIMQPFGSDWVCRLCRSKMIESAKQRGQNRENFAFDASVFTKRLGYIFFCLFLGSAVFASKWSAYEELFKYSRKGRKAQMSKVQEQLYDAPDTPTIFLLAPDSKPEFDSLKEARFLVIDIQDELYAFTTIPSDAALNFDPATCKLKLKSWESYENTAETSGLVRQKVANKGSQIKRDLILCRVTTPRKRLTYPPPKIRPGALPQMEKFCIITLAADRKTDSVRWGSSTGPIVIPLMPNVPPLEMNGGTILGKEEDPAALAGVPVFDEDGNFAAITLEAKSGDGPVTVVMMEKAEVVTTMTSGLPK